MDFQALAALSIHDVKNRLASCAGRAEAAGDRQTRDELIAAAQELSRLLLLFKAENGLLRPQIDAHSPAELLEELALAVPPARRGELDTAAAPTLAYYDRTLVQLVLGQAVDNALRHARESIRLRARSDPTARWLIFSIEDDGPGFPAALLESFPQAAPVSATGTGLGLYLSTLVAALHQAAGLSGRVQLENAGGACFRLWLPL
jgi:signal transduction histidine kinase